MSCSDVETTNYRLSSGRSSRLDDLPNFPFTKADPIIVTRTNPVDTHAIGER
jgi:oxalate decarboxylase